MSTEDLEVLRMSFPFDSSINEFDPQVVNSTTDANLSRNLYSRLFNLDDSGQLQGDLAENLHWDGEAYQITIRTGVKTKSGHTITAEDAYLSLLRMIRNNAATHGSLRYFLCPDYASEKKCHGLSYHGYQLTLKPSSPNIKNFILPLLASTDFSIIPKTSLDEETLALTDPTHQETTGPYYVEEDNPNGHLRLRANPDHYKLSKNNFDQIELVSGQGENVFSLLRQGKVDFVPTVNISDIRHLTAEDRKIYNVWESNPIRLGTLAFTQKGRENLSRQQRLKIGSLIRNNIIPYYNSSVIPTVEYLLRSAEGGLSHQQIETLKNEINKAMESDITQTVTISVASADYEEMLKLEEVIPFLKVIPFRKMPWLQSKEEQPDALFARIDSSFYEDISLLHYNFSTSIFLTPEEGKSWLDNYIRTEDKAKRLEKLQNLHFRVLYDAQVAPVFHSTYFAIAPQNVHIGFSKFYAGSPLWMLTKN